MSPRRLLDRLASGDSIDQTCSLLDYNRYARVAEHARLGLSASPVRETLLIAQ
jgi:hypothetical protein